MRLASFLAFSTVASLAIVFAQDSCPVDGISCAAPDADSCCVPTYGKIVLTQQWIPGYGPDDAFTIHGLWPNTCSGGQGPSNGCDPSRAYSDIGEIIQNANSSLYDQMDTYWPSYKGNNPEFWEHEWEKHGTCVSTLDPDCYGSDYQEYEDMLDYFQSVLNLRAKYDLYAALASAGITPGGTYTQTRMANAIKSRLGITPYFKCKSGTLNEIWAYFHVKGKETYIPDNFKGSHSCSNSIKYPSK
ncbi:RNase Sy [Basidiobolus meristosporus CBS 931.73]|uniref:ribonuclease T2 n=1 Tax=Basidiobolus meristosporus CBS 931.73 TaxID=1314790 RepID=A0A1Y1XTW9_9FUNG|nr:RNase Sy [Basidiobolus meristosporus CBS 931.73]|eukprot:ORX88734.1 RNase Sy [Basidiobolus meristosporus CBS 931.73]